MYAVTLKSLVLQLYAVTLKLLVLQLYSITLILLVYTSLRRKHILWIFVNFKNAIFCNTYAKRIWLLWRRNTLFKMDSFWQKSIIQYPYIRISFHCCTKRPWMSFLLQNCCFAPSRMTKMFYHSWQSEIVQMNINIILCPFPGQTNLTFIRMRSDRRLARRAVINMVEDLICGDSNTHWWF